MHTLISKISIIAVMSSALGACGGGGSSSTSVTPPATFKNFSSGGSAKPIIGAATQSLAQTGVAATQAMNGATYDQPTDTLTVKRTAASDVTFTASSEQHPSNSNLRYYSVSGSENGDAILATTTKGDGYAVAYINDTLSTDPEGSVIMGAASSTAPNLVNGATFRGKYLGTGRYATASFQASDTITGDVTATVAATNVSGVISNRVAGNSALGNVTWAAAPVTGNNFSAAATGTGLFNFATTGTVNGTFVEVDSNNPDGEIIGSVLLQGPGCGPTITTGTCAIETGVFTAK
ncbi:hypothetical protein N9A67_05215 [Rhodobacteraceae bacterium]|nr:hypothetical protein [Paracoccaceae bacterium]